MNASGDRRPPSLRRAILLASATAGLALLVGVTSLLHLTSRIREDLTRASRALVEEERIANRIDRAVTRGFLVTSEEQLEGEIFRSAGEEIYGAIQRYLFRPLSSAERLQIERMKEEHQRLEVAAALTAERIRRGDREAAEEARRSMLASANSLLAVLDAFLELRSGNLDRLRQRQETSFRTLQMGVVGFAVLLLGGAVVMGLLLHRRITVPLGELSQAAGRIGAGDLDARVSAGEQAEFAALAASFNRMAESLEDTRSDLEERNRQLTDALERLRRTQADLIQSEKLGAMGRMTAGLAHQLNNPLASVLGYGELLLDRLDDARGPNADEIREEFVQPVVDEARRARTLVRNFLSFSRESTGRMEPVHLAGVLEMVVGLRRFAFEEAEVEIAMELRPDLWVRGERQRLQEVFLNLVNNAIDSMREEGAAGSTLRIRMREEGERVVVEVEDEGTGIEHPDRIFELFYTTKPPGEGTGLGLALVHTFVESCGGRARAENVEGGGARLIIALPRVAAPAPGSEREAPPAESEREVLATGPGREVPDEPEKGAATPSAPRSPGEASPPLVLVVEDEPHLRTVQERILRRLPARVVLADSAAGAREVLREQDVDLVVSDIRMPGESGIALYEWILRERPALAGRFLFVTGDVRNPDLAEMASERTEIFIQKPFEIADYLERVASILDSSTPI